MNKFSDDIQEIHSADAYYKNVILRNNNLIMPYINLGVSNHPIQRSKDGMTFIDFSYMVFKEVSYLSIYIENFKRLEVIDIDRNCERFFFGGQYLDIDAKIFNDLIVSSKEAYLVTLDFSRYLDSPVLYADVKSGRFSEKLSSDFFEHKYLPESIRRLVE